MIVKPHTIQRRLQQWGRWIEQPHDPVDRTASVFGRIVEMKQNAGIYGDGVRYDMVTVGDETVMCRPDGGMAAAVERNGRQLAMEIRCRELHAAFTRLSAEKRKVIAQTFRVPPREEPRSCRAVAAILGYSHSHVAKLQREAYEELAAAIYGRFEVVASAKPAPATPEPASERLLRSPITAE